VTTKDLETRVRRLEDLEAIKQLKARYCRLCADGYDADRLAEATVIRAEDRRWTAERIVNSGSRARTTRDRARAR
jgi:hypothetical protein